MRPKTLPPRYNRPLTAEMSEARRRIEQHQEELDEEIDTLTAQEVKTPQEMRRLMRLRSEAERTELKLEYQGADPKKLPKATLLTIMNDPLNRDTAEDKQRSKMRTRAQAIRQFCVHNCMSGSVQYVRECASISCEFHPFRMGKDPFRGYELPKIVVVASPDAAIEDDDLDAEFGEGDDGDETDAKE